MDTIGLIWLSILFFYCLTKILDFYGVAKSTYQTYLFFYMFIALCILVLPKDDQPF